MFHISYHVTLLSWTKNPQTLYDTVTVLKSWPTFIFQLTKQYIVFFSASLSSVCLLVKNLNPLHHLVHCPSRFLNNMNEVLQQRQPVKNEIILSSLHNVVSNVGGHSGPPLSIFTRVTAPWYLFQLWSGSVLQPRGMLAISRARSFGCLSTPGPKGSNTKSGKSMSIRERQAEGEGVGDREASTCSQGEEVIDPWPSLSPCVQAGLAPPQRVRRAA